MWRRKQEGVSYRWGRGRSFLGLRILGGVRRMRHHFHHPAQHPPEIKRHSESGHTVFKSVEDLSQGAATEDVMLENWWKLNPSKRKTDFSIKAKKNLSMTESSQLI